MIKKIWNMARIVILLSLTILFALSFYQEMRTRGVLADDPTQGDLSQ